MAIRKAIQYASPGEIILVAGKGHEEQQIFKNKVFNISDKKIIQNIKIKKEIINKKKQTYLQNRLLISKVIGKTKETNFKGLSIDTRSIKKENLFLAITGKK